MRIDNTKENGRHGSVHLTETPLPLHPGKHQDLKALLRYMCWVHVQFVFSKKGLGREKLLSQCKKKKILKADFVHRRGHIKIKLNQEM